MTLHDLHLLKRWHVAHRAQHPVEYHVYDLVLMLWVGGWSACPAALLLGRPWMLLGCALGVIAPAAYVGLRLSLHARGRLRCDWHAAWHAGTDGSGPRRR